MRPRRQDGRPFGWAPRSVLPVSPPIRTARMVETNEAAVRLWRPLGFTIIGTVPGAFPHLTQGRVGLHVMHLSLR